MQLSELLGSVVFDGDGTRLGTIIDVRLATSALNGQPDVSTLFGVMSVRA